MNAITAHDFLPNGSVFLSCMCRALASHIPQEGDRNGGIAPAGSSSSTDEPVASASSSYEEGPDGVAQWGVIDWPKGVPRRCSWRWRGALTGGCAGASLSGGGG